MRDVPEIAPRALRERLAGAEGSRPVLLDVRTHEEHRVVALPDSVLIPLHELAQRISELEPARTREIVVYCHHGIRSLSAAALLLSRGYDAQSLAGGIELYAQVAEPTLPRY
jgi:rhodanese-related sulfurtransferase